MAPSVTELLGVLSLGQSCVQFNPTGEHAWMNEEMESIPHHLIRIYTPRSAGSNDEFWVKSRDGRLNKTNWDVDIFLRDNAKVAKMLNTHLRWWGESGDYKHLFLDEFLALRSSIHLLLE